MHSYLQRFEGLAAEIKSLRRLPNPKAHPEPSGSVGRVPSLIIPPSFVCFASVRGSKSLATVFERRAP